MVFCLVILSLLSGQCASVFTSNLLTRSETDVYSSETKTSRTMTFTNYNEGSVTTKDVINPSLSAGVDVSGNQKLTMNINDKVTAQFSAGDWNNVGSAPTDLAYLDDLKSQISPEKLTLQPIQFTEQSWNDANRGLTATGQVVIAVGITVATVASLGTAAPVTSGMAAGGWTAVGTSAGVAVASSAAATASVSATNASMNADGNFFGSLDDVGNTTIKDTTSSDSLRSYAIAGITAGAANWASDYFKIAEMGKAASAANTVDGTRTAAQVIQNLKVSLIESAISNGTSSVVQSIVNGDSTSDTLKHLAVNVGVGAVGNAAAKEIGIAYKTDQIKKPTQLALHAALGAGVAALTGNDAASGAVSGVVGELVAGPAFDDLNTNSMNAEGFISNDQFMRNRALAIQLSGLAGGLSSIFTANAMGLEDQQVADNVFSGQRIGGNAAENNALRFKGTKIFPYPKKDYDLNVGIEYTTGPISVNHGTDGDGVTVNTVPGLGMAAYFNVMPSGESSVLSASYGIRDVVTFDAISTNKGNAGFGMKYGINVIPVPIPFNSGMSVDFNK